MTIDLSSDEVNLSLVICECLLFLNDIGPNISLQSIVLKEQSVCGSKARKGHSCLNLQLKIFSQHPHMDCGRVADSLRCLVQLLIGFLPVQDSSLEKIIQDRIVQHLLVQGQKIVMGPDHIGPKMIIDIEIQEPVSMLSLLDHQAVLPIFFRKTGAILTLAEDLVTLIKLVKNFKFIHTGGEGWFTESVNCKQITSKWKKNQPNYLPSNC